MSVIPVDMTCSSLVSDESMFPMFVNGSSSSSTSKTSGGYLHVWLPLKHLAASSMLPYIQYQVAYDPVTMIPKSLHAQPTNHSILDLSISGLLPPIAYCMQSSVYSWLEYNESPIIPHVIVTSTQRKFVLTLSWDLASPGKPLSFVHYVRIILQACNKQLLKLSGSDDVHDGTSDMMLLSQLVTSISQFVKSVPFCNIVLGNACVTATVDAAWTPGTYTIGLLDHFSSLKWPQSFSVMACLHVSTLTLPVKFTVAMPFCISPDEMKYNAALVKILDMLPSGLTTRSDIQILTSRMVCSPRVNGHLYIHNCSFIAPREYQLSSQGSLSYALLLCCLPTWLCRAPYISISINGVCAYKLVLMTSTTQYHIYIEDTDCGPVRAVSIDFLPGPDKDDSVSGILMLANVPVAHIPVLNGLSHDEGREVVVMIDIIVSHTEMSIMPLSFAFMLAAIDDGFQVPQVITRIDNNQEWSWALH